MDCEGGCDEHLEENTSASNNKRVTFSPLIIVLNSDHGGGCSPGSETNLRGTERSSAESSDSSDDVSSPSSNSSFDDFIQINPQLILLKSRGENNIPQPNRGTKPSYENEKCSVTSDAFYRLEEFIDKSLESTSQFTDVTHASLVEHVLPTLSPSIQVMEWPEGFDPKRISSSHSSRPSTPVEGSAASDDSLFSIHIESKSFSRDDSSRTDVDLYKPEERPKSGELFKIAELCQSSEPCKSREFCQSGEKGMANEPVDDVSKAPMNNQVDTNIGDFADSSSAKCQSDNIEASIQPLALPIKKKSSSPLCSCPDCCLAFCCCKWPSRYSKWPGCSFKWFIRPRCSRNCLSWLGCCCKWPSCHCKWPIWSSCCVKRQC